MVSRKILAKMMTNALNFAQKNVLTYYDEIVIIRVSRTMVVPETKEAPRCVNIRGPWQTPT
jgi:hypothetical protein